MSAIILDENLDVCLHPPMLTPQPQRRLPPKKRLKVPIPVQKRVWQEAGSKCVFCPETEVAALQIHHMDGDRTNSALANLLLACATCHAKITGGIISAEEVRLKKLQFAQPGQKSLNAISSLDGVYLEQPRFVPRRLGSKDMRMS